MPSEAHLTPAEIRSGYTFLTPETQVLQDDSFANPGYLWVDRGAALFRAEETAPSCISCHSGGLSGIAATYPKVNTETGELRNLEGQINACRTQQQSADPLEYESDDLLALTAYIANQSIGAPIAIDTTGTAASYLTQGGDYFFTKRGQFNLSCAQCHDQNWGKKLRGDTISQGHLNGFPAYRLEWEALGSSHRRLRDCDTGVRAEALPFGDPQYIALELYLAARATDLAIESPAVRR
jgi:sulfur-oxidizing protein SoxA